MIGFGARHPAEVAAINGLFGEKIFRCSKLCVRQCPKGRTSRPGIWDAAKGARESPPLERESSVKPVRIRRGIVRANSFAIVPSENGGPTRSAFGYLSSLGPRPFGNTRSNTRLVKRYFVKHGFVFWQENRFRDAILLRIFTYFKRENGGECFWKCLKREEENKVDWYS